MKKNIIPIIAIALAVAACGSKTQSFQSADGSLKATVDGKGQWTFAGDDAIVGYDSLRVTQVSEEGNPMTVVYYFGERQHVCQYFSNMKKRSEGDLVDGRYEGHWVFYHPNGAVQSECTFVEGKEEGVYRVYRENGTPYYVGQYSGGKRVGVWEVYDADGQMVQKKDYGNG